MEDFAQKFLKEYNVSRETFLQLADYVEILLKWQAKINLISPTTINDIWQRHIEDSLQLLSYVPRETSAIIDIGSGGGLPGIPLAITTKLPTTLIESDSRKCFFLEEAARITKSSNIKICNNRIEKAKITLPHASGTLITARALADITDLLRIINILCSNNNISEYKILLPKGKNAIIELEQAKLQWKFDCKINQSTTDNTASVLQIENLRSIK